MTTMLVDVARCPGCPATNVQGLRMRWAPEAGPLAFKGECPHRSVPFYVRWGVPGREERRWLGARNRRHQP